MNHDQMDEPHRIARSLLRQGTTVAVAESATAGAIQAALGQVHGASDWFRGGVVAYHLDTKVAVLGVDRQHARAVGCVSQRVAKEMAMGVRELMRADIGVATTGFIEVDEDAGVTKPRVAYAFIGGDIHPRVGWLSAEPDTRVNTQHELTRQVLSALANAVGDPTRVN